MGSDSPAGEDLWQTMSAEFLAPEPAPDVLERLDVGVRAFLAADVDRPAFIRERIRGDRGLAFYVLRRMPLHEVQALLPELLLFASWPNGYLAVSLELIRSLPRDWVVSHLEESSEGLLSKGDEEQYHYLLRLFESLDSELAERLAKRAASSDNEDVSFVGEEFLERKGRWASRDARE